ncbi:MAG: hypothetical protein ABJN04_15110 [Hyphomicrobiales bacterium]
MMIAAVGLPLAIFAIGSAVDYANFLLATRQVQAALDSASFAATRAITVEDLTLDEAALSAREQLMLNIANLSFIDAQAIASSLRLEHDKEIGKLTAIADLQTPTLFAGLFGYDNISTTVVATNQVQSLEMSFVLDNTGSMSFSFADGSSNKNDERIIALRAAMYNAVDRLLPAGRVNDNRVRVSITPYSDAVNLGQFYQAAVGEDGPDRGSSCVTEREGMEAFNDIAPDDSDPDTLYETDVALNPDHCINSRILPLTDDREDLFSAIDRLDTKGRTAGHIGITWGLNTLSGEWRLFWPSSARPARYLTTNVTKILIVMTDGTFNTTYFDDKAVEGPNGDLGRGGSANETTSENATREFCDLAKDPSRGVRVYTVTLGTSAAAGALMAECATNASTAFIVTTGDELDEAFEQIVIQARTPILTD